MLFQYGGISLPGVVDASVRGTGLSYDFTIGGTIAEGLVLAFGFSDHSMKVDLTNDTRKASKHTLRHAYEVPSLRVVYHPNARKGLYFQGGVGAVTSRFRGLVVDRVPSDNGFQSYAIEDLSGTHFLLGVGYEAFVSDEWSIGGLLRADLSRISHDKEPDVTGTLFAPSIRLTFTYH
jgi:hypothetical protein